MSSYHAGMEIQAEDLANPQFPPLPHLPSDGNEQVSQALAFVLERMLRLTGATAAAIALFDGDSIVCRASSGNAPPVGARVDPDSGLSGECVRTGRVVRCDDTEADPRVDRLLCRGLELRSMLIVPVLSEGRPAGILEVFSAQPNAFDSVHEQVLRALTEIIVTTAVTAPDPPPVESHQSELIAVALASPLANPEPDEPPSTSVHQASLALPAEDSGVHPSPAAAQEQPGEHADNGADAVPPVVIAMHQPVSAGPSSSSTEEDSSREQFTAPMLTARLTSQPYKTLRLSLAGVTSIVARRFSAWKPTIAAGFGSLKIRGAAVSLLLLVVFVAGWRHWRPDPPPSTTSAQIVVTENQLAPVQTPAHVAAVLASASNTAARRDTASDRDVSEPDPAPAKAEPSAPVITLPPPDLAVSQEPPLITQLARPSGQPSAIAGVLDAPLATPRLVVPRVSQMTGGELLRKVDPVYPSAAPRGTQGAVLLKAIIDSKGHVAKLRVISGEPVLAQAAVAAVSRWRYQPFLLNGVPIQVESDISVNFKAPRQ